jgi:hypothetical protein
MSSETQEPMFIDEYVDDKGDTHYESTNQPKICYMTKTYKKKNGDVVVKQYNQTKYNNLYYLNHKEQLCEKIRCECGVEYTKLGKCNHMKSKVHKMYRLLCEEHNIN